MSSIVLFGMPTDYGGANREAGDTVLLWRQAGIEVTILPCNPMKSDNPWPKRLADAGCTIETPFLNGQPPAWLADSIVVDFQAERCVRLWPELKKRRCRLVHLPCHCYTMPHEDASFKITPPTAVVCQSEFQKQAIAARYASYGTSDMRRIPAAFNTEFFPYRPCPRRNGNFIVGSIGRDDPLKWPPRIIKTLKAARKSGVKIHGKFLGWTPAVEKHSGKLPKWVYHHPPGSYPTDAFLAECHCLLAMSDYCENAPRIVLEAMSSGVPVIADANAGYFEMIRHGETGLLAGSEIVAADLLCQLAEDDRLRMGLADNARDSLTQIAPAETTLADWHKLFATIT